MMATYKMVTCSDPENCCSICLNTMSSNNVRKYNKKMTCGHVFHPHCINKWSQRGTTCPCCRTPLFKCTDVDDMPLSYRRLQLLLTNRRRPLRDYSDLFEHDTITVATSFFD
jgi:hypothetical protein